MEQQSTNSVKCTYISFLPLTTLYNCLVYITWFSVTKKRVICV